MAIWETTTCYSRFHYNYNRNNQSGKINDLLMECNLQSYKQTRGCNIFLNQSQNESRSEASRIVINPKHFEVWFWKADFFELNSTEVAAFIIEEVLRLKTMMLIMKQNAQLSSCIFHYWRWCYSAVMQHLTIVKWIN